MYLLSLSFSLGESSDIWQRLPRRWETSSYQGREGDKDERRVGRSEGKKVLKTKRQWLFLADREVRAMSTMWTGLLSHSYGILSWNRYPSSWSRGSSPVLGEAGERGRMGFCVARSILPLGCGGRDGGGAGVGECPPTLSPTAGRILHFPSLRLLKQGVCLRGNLCQL